jgi:predicted phosphoribosyltransferase
MAAPEVSQGQRITAQQFKDVVAQAQAEINRRSTQYRFAVTSSAGKAAKV